MYGRKIPLRPLSVIIQLTRTRPNFCRLEATNVNSWRWYGKGLTTRRQERNRKYAISRKRNRSHSSQPSLPRRESFLHTSGTPWWTKPVPTWVSSNVLHSPGFPKAGQAPQEPGRLIVNIWSYERARVINVVPCPILSCQSFVSERAFALYLSTQKASSRRGKQLRRTWAVPLIWFHRPSATIINNNNNSCKRKLNKYHIDFHTRLTHWLAAEVIIESAVPFPTSSICSITWTLSTCNKHYVENFLQLYK